MKSSSLLTAKLLFCLLFITNIVSSQQRVESRQELVNKFSSLINRAETCEGYPYLSADGLRLYFTTDREGGFGRLYFCSRSSVSENFNAPRRLSRHLPDGYYAATLTADELTIYMCHESKIYTANRKSINDEFGKPELLTLIKGDISAPAISQNGNELIVLGADTTGWAVAIHFRKNNAGIFIEVNRMPAPGDADLDPGQFSKDGLSFYASYEVQNDESDPTMDTEESEDSYTQKIIRFTRKSLQDNFGTSEEVPDLSSPMRNHQPTMNEDETIFIVTNSEKDLWSENELRLINFKQDSIFEYNCFTVVVRDCEPCEELESESLDTAALYFPLFEYNFHFVDSLFIICDNICDWSVSVEYIIEELPESNVKVRVYPNPFVNDLIITLTKADLKPRFDLFDISGRKIFTTTLNNVSNRIQLNRPGAGVYIYTLTDESGKLINSGKLVKK